MTGKKEELIAEGVNPDDIVCPNIGYLASHNIWHVEYPSKGDCYDNSKIHPMSSKSDVSSMSPSEMEKNRIS